MEEFKKPCLPIVPLKVEKSEASSENPEEYIEKSDVNIIKPQDSQLCPYKVPQWSQLPCEENKYSFEVLKSGQIISEVEDLQKKAYWTFGRFPENDIEMAHPTISRFHAILQYRPKNAEKQLESIQNKEEENFNRDFENKGPPEGWYVFDLGSTHGTFLNKQRIPSKVYIRMRVGHMLRLGASTRSYILQGPSSDEEPESELSVTELKTKSQEELEQATLKRKLMEEKAIEIVNNEGCNWGMLEDADEETDLTHNPYASTNNEELFLDDPKKTLRGYFEREGLELIYKCDEMSAGSFVCRVELPIDDANGRPIVAEIVHKGKKKDCVVQCALEACRILDRHGVLRQANQEPLKRKQKSQESDSDDDEFWDRTGDVARKRQRKANADSTVTLTYEDLLKEESDIDKQIKQTEFRIINYQEREKCLKAQTLDNGEDLDAFMENLQGKDTKLDKTEIRKLRLEEQRLKSDKQRVQKLIEIAKPINLPFNNQVDDKIQHQTAKVQTNVKKQQLPMIGKRNQFSKFKIVKMESKTANKETKPVKLLYSDEEEVEEEDKTDEINIDNESIQSKDNLHDKDRINEQGNENNESEMNNTETIEGIPSNSNKNKTYKSVESKNDDKYEKADTTHLDSLQLSVISETCSSSSKKRRQRIRQRGRRQEVDMDDDIEYESTDKYAKWIPPANQTGDGITELNKKFGY